MEDENYKLQVQENLKNPKNRYLGCFCHAKDVDNSWGCNWSFQCGVIVFSIVVFICSVADVYHIAGRKVFVKSPNGLFTFFFIFKVVSDVLNFITMGLGFVGVGQHNLKLSIIAYWLSVASLALNTIFFIYIFVAIFIWSDLVWPVMITVIFLEIGLVILSWILFANQVDLGRKKREQAAQANSPY